MRKEIIRKALHCGTWYPATRHEIAQFIPERKTKIKAIGALCPHAGWVYSGQVAGKVYSLLEPAELYVILGPNHRGSGSRLSIFPSGEWETPLGNITVDGEFASELKKFIPQIELETVAHEQEHSIEVQLPFIKYLAPNARIAPISVLDYNTSLMKSLGLAIADTLLELKIKSFVIIASSDMSHYISKDLAHQKDMLAINNILKLDPEAMQKSVALNDITMCGSGPAAAMLWAANALGAEKAEVIKYTTSADVTGDNSEVVAYAGIIVY